MRLQSPAELGEYARSTYLARGKTYPTASSYQLAVAFGPESPIAKIIMKSLRAPGFVLPPFNRPRPSPPIPFDHPDHPDHTPEARADVREIAWCLRSWRAKREELPPPDPDKSIPPSLWKKCFHLRRRYRSLEEALVREGLAEYR
jgi:hypothetical protein